RHREGRDTTGGTTLARDWPHADKCMPRIAEWLGLRAGPPIRAEGDAPGAPPPHAQPVTGPPHAPIGLGPPVAAPYSPSPGPPASFFDSGFLTYFGGLVSHRRETDPVDAENRIARIEGRIRAVLSRGGSVDERLVKQRSNYTREGIWAWTTRARQPTPHGRG